MNSATLNAELPTSRTRTITGGNPPEPPNNPQTALVGNLLENARKKLVKAKRGEELQKVANAIKKTPNPSSVPDSERSRGNNKKRVRQFQRKREKPKDQHKKSNSVRKSRDGHKGMDPVQLIHEAGRKAREREREREAAREMLGAAGDDERVELDSDSPIRKRSRRNDDSDEGDGGVSDGEASANADEGYISANAEEPANADDIEANADDDVSNDGKSTDNEGEVNSDPEPPSEEEDVQEEVVVMTERAKNNLV